MGKDNGAGVAVDDDILARANTVASSNGGSRKDGSEYDDYYSDYDAVAGDEDGGGSGSNPQYTARSGSGGSAPPTGRSGYSYEGGSGGGGSARSGSGEGYSQPGTARSGGSYERSGSGSGGQSEPAGTTARSGYSGAAGSDPASGTNRSGSQNRSGSGSARLPATDRSGASGSAPYGDGSGGGYTARSGAPASEGSQGGYDDPYYYSEEGSKKGGNDDPYYYSQYDGEGGGKGDGKDGYDKYTPRSYDGAYSYGESYYDKPADGKPTGGDKKGGGGGGGDDKYSDYYSGYSGYSGYGYSGYYSDEKPAGDKAGSAYSYDGYYDYSNKDGYDYYTYSGEGEGYSEPPYTARSGGAGAAADDAGSVVSEVPGAADGAPLLGAAPAASAQPAADGTHVGLGIQLQEPEAGEQAGAGFRVTRLIRGAPGDACGLICEGDVLVAIDGRSVVTTRFSAVSALLRGDEGTTISLEFERTVRERGELRTRAFEVTLRRARFLLPQMADDADDAASELSEPVDDATGAAGRARGKKAGYWEGYRAAMAQKAPPFAGSIASFDSEDPDEDASEAGGALPTSVLPRSPSVSDDEGVGLDTELETEQQLAGALAAGATVGLPGAGAFGSTLPTEEELAAERAEEEAEEASMRAELAPGAAAWVDRLGKWEGVLTKAHEGAIVKSELMTMWKLKMTAMRAKLGVEEGAVRAQLDSLANQELPQSRAQPARTAKVIEQVQASGGKQTPSELLLELERQMVEAERWRAETQRLAALLKRSQHEIGRKGDEMSKLRAQTITWSADNKAKRSELRAKADELDELKAQHAAVVSQATMWEERSNKLQDELKLKSELATMWKRSAEKAGAGDVAEVGAAALTWKVEAEKASHEATRWRELARKAEEQLSAKQDEALRYRTQYEAARLQAERIKEEQVYQRSDAGPQEEITAALLAAQEDLNAKSEEAKQLRDKVMRLETAIRELM